MRTTTVGGYLATRFEQIGLKHYFMVPGDYNLVLLDELLANKNVEQIGCCNELNAVVRRRGIRTGQRVRGRHHHVQRGCVLGAQRGGRCIRRTAPGHLRLGRLQHQRPVQEPPPSPYDRQSRPLLPVRDVREGHLRGGADRSTPTTRRRSSTTPSAPHYGSASRHTSRSPAICRMRPALSRRHSRRSGSCRRAIPRRSTTRSRQARAICWRKHKRPVLLAGTHLRPFGAHRGLP